MPYATISLTSATAGQSTAVSLNWRGGKPISVSIFPSTGVSSAAWSLQYTLDDVTLIPAGSTSVTWFNYVSSAIGVPGITYGATTTGTDGSFFPLLSPVTAVRLNSTNITGGTVTMKVVQAEGW